MTLARTVRLLAIIVIVTGVSAWRLSLFAQSPGQVRQYDPDFDGTSSSLASYDESDWGDIPAYVSAISGEARLERDGDVTGDFEQVPLQIGDQVRTTRGRVEVLYDDGSVVALDEYSAVSVDGESTWRLHTGRMKVVSRTGTFVVDAAPVGLARLRNGGDYRITLAVNRRGEPELELAATRGSAELENRLGRTLVRAGTRALTTAEFAPSVPYAFSAPRDEFERWTESLEADRYGVTSVQYLPTELRAYGGEFDRYGYWSHHHSHGWVWYPRVAVGWEPFRSGRWSFVIGFGYNWIGGHRWEWPTHYYGRWDRYGSRWFWVPTRPVSWHRIGYSAPRNSFNISVSYYSRPQPNRSLPTYRGTTSQRSRIVEPPRDNRRPSSELSQPTTQPRVAIPRSSAINRQPNAVVTQPQAPQISRESSRSTSPTNRGIEERTARPRETPQTQSEDRTFRTRQAPQPQGETPRFGRVPRPIQEVPQSPRTETFSRQRTPSARPAPERPAPSVEPPRPSSSGSAQPRSRGESPRPSAGPGLPDRQRASAPPPAGSRTPSQSARPSGTAVRRGGGGDR